MNVSVVAVNRNPFIYIILTFVLWLAAGNVSLAEEEYEKLEGVPFISHNNADLLADVYMPRSEGQHPGVLLIHGGGWLAGGRRELRRVAMQMAPLGFTLVAIDYRLAPKDKFPAQIDDCKAAIDWMRENAAKYKIDPNRLGAWGYSAGGHLAALLGTTCPFISAVVAGGAPCDFRPIKPDNRFLAFWLGGSPREMPGVYEKASPAYHISPDDPPFFFYHGQNDFLVPIDQPFKMASLLQAAKIPAEVYTVTEKGHDGALRDDKAVELGIEFMCKQLLLKSSASNPSAASHESH